MNPCLATLAGSMSDGDMSHHLGQAHVDIVVQNALSTIVDESMPTPAEMIDCARLSLSIFQSSHSELSAASSELTIRLADADEVQELNRTYRDKDKPTNVLSFPFMGEEISPLGDGPDLHLLGDIVLCHSVIETEAKEQNKDINHHYLHMIVHGVLHLCGMDHQVDQDASQMEKMEVQILAKLGVANPYTG